MFSVISMGRGRQEVRRGNTQLYNTLDEHNRFKLAEAVTAPAAACSVGAMNAPNRFTWIRDSTFTLQALHFLDLDWEATSSQ
jgi:hypothetical protein